mmetsp:Transcript_15837/g.34161  ORF Transcript_15837/g.34161 Transcript_15837/m.34161 type:complete len:490 (-) Transcript_15837:247-1716(-)|eukprot:CAMPEP_0202911032 /NCGR_PEP_ID=MMETSP1392-20130828/53817_1 /ASSEMBLY_ACC=CAM_ASM_000868 /TAXON_ID=225041 /ORGANISM="Chlamydomonas chlamydogama, Strain SAG 11-48b" /LENGTH=489 /DNA_ID=CAMNT_0049601389 /DNA_START=94 /DNA_END=1563 /DNA_ORIENTATION=-
MTTHEHAGYPSSCGNQDDDSEQAGITATTPLLSTTTTGIQATIRNDGPVTQHEAVPGAASSACTDCQHSVSSSYLHHKSQAASHDTAEVVTCIVDLPNQLLQEIGEQLTVFERSAMRAVCRCFRAVYPLLKVSLDLKLTISCGQPVFTLAVTPDGRFVAAGADNRKAHMWRLDSGKEVADLMGSGMPANVLSMSVSRDGKVLVTGTQHGKLLVYDLAKKCERLDYVEAALAAGQTSATDMARLHRFWSPLREMQVPPLQQCTLPQVALLGPGGLTAVTGGGWNDPSIRVWDLQAGTCTARLRGHRDGVTCLAVSPNGKFAVSSNQTCPDICIWNLGQQRQVGSLTGHRGTVKCVAVLPSNRHVISGGADGTLRLWDLNTGEVRLLVKGGSLIEVTCLAVSPDGLLAVVGYWTGLLRVWCLTLGKVLCRASHDSEVSCVHWLPDGKGVVSGGRDGRIMVWSFDCTLSGSDGQAAAPQQVARLKLAMDVQH